MANGPIEDVLPEQPMLEAPEQQAAPELAPDYDPFAAPIPGQSLTNSPDNPMPFETPVENVNVNGMVENMFLNLTKEDNIEEVLSLLRSDIPVEDVASTLIFETFRTGKATPDLMLLMLEPVMYMLISIADWADIDVTIYPEEDLDKSKDEETMELDKFLTEEGEIDPDAPAPEGVTPDLVEAIKQQVENQEDDK